MLIALLWVQAITAQSLPKNWTLMECINYALENNIQVQSSSLQTELDKNNLEAARGRRLPDLRAGSTIGWNFGLNIDPVTNEISRTSRNTASLSLSSNLTLFDGLRIHNSIAQNNLQYLASLADLEKAKNDVSLNVISAYLQIMLNKEILQVAREQVKVSDLQVNRTRKLVDAGAAPEGDWLQFVAQQARDEQNLIAAENAVLISKLNLANLLQLERPEEFEIIEPELNIPAATHLATGPHTVYESAVASQPEIKAAETRIESSEKAIAVSKGAYYPSLSVFGQVATSYSDQIIEPTGFEQYNGPIGVTANNEPVYLIQPQQVATGYADVPFVDQVGDNINEYVGLSLSIPIFNRLQVKNNVQNARVSYEINQLQLEQTKNDMRRIIYQAHADARASFNSYRAAEKATEASQASFDYAEDRYEVGAINQFDFENAKNNLAVARSEMLRAKYDYIFKMKVLEFYLTNQIKL